MTDAPGGRGGTGDADAAFAGLLARLELAEAAGGGRASGAARDTLTEPRPEPVTPELALVDPELARRARAALPVSEPSRPRPARRVAAPAVRPAPAPPPAPAAPRRRRGWRGLAAVTALALLFAGGVAVARHPWSRSSAPSAPGAPTTLTRGQQPAAPATGRTDAAAPAPATKPAATRSATRARTRPTHASAPRPRRRPHVLRVAPHSFAWIRVPTAAYYLLRIYRGRTLIFVAEPRTNRIVLPSAWTFAGRTHRLASGRYRWSVRPGFGPPSAKRYGREIVRAALVVQ